MPRCRHMIHVNQQFHSEMQRMQKLQRHFTKQRKLYILPWLGCSRMSQMKHHLRVSSKVNMMGKQCFLWMSRKRRLGPTRGNNCLPQIFPYLHDEPHEPGDESDEGNDCAQLFQDENDEDESSCESDDDSGYSADCDDAPPPSKPTVDLAFATVSKFLASQLAQSRGQASTPSAQPLRKKRIYNNSNRAAKAQQRKAVLPPAAPKEKRNSPASWCGLTTCCICCFCCSAFQHLNLELKHVQSKERLSRLLASKCKCSTGECYMQYSRDQLQKFLDAFEGERQKRTRRNIVYIYGSSRCIVCNTYTPGLSSVGQTCQ